MIEEMLNVMRPGTKKQASLYVGSMSSGAKITIPVTVIKGVTDGPCLWINGQVHGGEVNGVVTAVEFGRRLNPGAMCGSIVITPTANPLAFDNRSKTAPQDLQDLDQNFPGAAHGSVTGYLAQALFVEIRKVAACVVNLHTMGPVYASDPYCIYKIWPGGSITEADLLRMTSYFSPSVSCRRIEGSGIGELPGNADGALDYQCLACGILSFMVELGQGGWYTPRNVELAIQGLMNLGRELGIFTGEAVVPASLRRATRRQWHMVREGGLFLSTINAKEVVLAGQLIGQVVTLTGKVVEEIRLPVDALIIGIRRDPVVHTGDRIGLFATEWNEVSLS